MLKRLENHSASAFAISQREVDERTSVITVEGELDLSTAPRLKWALIDSLESGLSRLVLDLSQVTFMDSTALGVLVVLNRRPELESPLTIVCPAGDVRHVFELAGLDGAFTMRASLHEALAGAAGAD